MQPSTTWPPSQCWGDSSQGQLGLNDNVVRGRAETDMGDNLPVVPLGAFDAASVDCGNFFNCAVSVSGSVKVCPLGERGDPTMILAAHMSFPW